MRTICATVTFAVLALTLACGSGAPTDTVAEADGVRIELLSVEETADATIISYRVSSEIALSDQVRSAVLILPDGSLISGLASGRTVIDEPSVIDEHTDRFPPLPMDASEIELRFGPYLSPTEGGEIVVTLPSPTERAAKGSQVVESTSESNGVQTLLVGDLFVKPSGFRLHLISASDGTDPVVGLPGARYSLEDDQGNTYTMTNRGLGFGKTDDGTIRFREDIINFEEDLDQAATELRVQVSAFGIMLSGPWTIPLDALD